LIFGSAGAFHFMLTEVLMDLSFNRSMFYKALIDVLQQFLSQNFGIGSHRVSMNPWHNT